MPVSRPFLSSLDISFLLAMLEPPSFQDSLKPGYLLLQLHLLMCLEHGLEDSQLLLSLGSIDQAGSIPEERPLELLSYRLTIHGSLSLLLNFGPVPALRFEPADTLQPELSYYHGS